MELNFEIPKWVHTFIEEPIYIVMWAAFGWFLFIAALGLLFKLIDYFVKIKLSTKLLSYVPRGTH